MVTITIAGKDYPMSYSLMAMRRIAEEYGSTQSALNLLKGEEVESKGVEAIGKILEILISQGCAYKNYFEKDVPIPKNAPVLDGVWTPLDEDTILTALDLSDIKTVADKILECVNSGKEREVEQVRKKQKAAPG